MIALNGITPKSDNTFESEVLGARAKPHGFKRDIVEALGYGGRANDPIVVGMAALSLTSRIRLLLRNSLFAKARGDLRILLTVPEAEKSSFTNRQAPTIGLFLLVFTLPVPVPRVITGLDA